MYENVRMPRLAAYVYERRAVSRLQAYCMEEFRRRVHTQAIRIEIQLSISRPKAIFQWFIAIIMFMRTSNEANTHNHTLSRASTC